MASSALPKGALWLQNVNYPATWDRSIFDALYASEGVLAGFGVIPNGGLGIRITPGMVVVTGDEVAGQGKYLVDSDANVDLTLAVVGSDRTEYVYVAVNDFAVGGRSGDNVTIETSTSLPSNSVLLLATITLTSGTSTITAGMIADNRTYTSTVPDGGVTTAKLANAAVTSAKLGTNSVDANAIAAAVVASSHLASNAVTTAKITDANVTTAKIANDAVTNAKMAPLSVGTTELINDAVTDSKLATGSVTTAKLATDAVTNSKIGLKAVEGDNIGRIYGFDLRDTSISIGSGANLDATFDTENYDAQNMHSPSATQANIPTGGAGYYLLTATSTNNNLVPYIRLNGGAAANNIANGISGQAMTMRYLADGDNLRVNIFNGSGSTEVGSVTFTCVRIGTRA